VHSCVLMTRLRSAGLRCRTVLRSCPLWPCLKCRVPLLAEGRRFCSTRASVQVDKSSTVAQVLEDFQEASQGFMQGTDVIALGQSGIFIALQFAATFRRESKVPLFTLDNVREGEKGAITRYRLGFSPPHEWRPYVKDYDSRLLFARSTKIHPFAAAVSARTAVLPEGRPLAIDTLLVGNEKSKLYRIAGIANGLGRVRSWELNPEREGPARLFRCMAHFGWEDTVSSKGQRESAAESWVLRILVFPEGPPKWKT